MFEVFSASAEIWLVVVLVLLLLCPVAFYLRGPWAYRRQEILNGLSARSVELYFKNFYPGLQNPDFRKFYHQRFGRRRYIIPSVMLFTTGLLVSIWTMRFALVATHLREATSGGLTDIGVLAFAGAYLWVVDDLISRWRFRDLSPPDVWRSSWRLVLAIPLAYAVGGLVRAELAGPTAFLLGAFPSRSVTTIARRLARRQFNLGADTDEKAESELEKLQGIDTRIAERFADEGITTIDQLAYADPVELTMRCASFAFSFVIDCTSQALAWIYLEDNLVKLRAWSLRGAQEIANLIDELDGDDEEDKALARGTMKVGAALIAVDLLAFERTLREIADDPYTDFINTIWMEEK